MMSNAGAEKFVHAMLGMSPITVRLPKNFSCETGETISLSVPKNRVHIFHKGRRLKGG
jgi:ABC-type sugar transport system ATPase subunit